MRIKKFTLMLMAVLFSVTGFAQKSFPVGKDIAFNRQAKVQTLVKKNTIGSSLAMQRKGASTQAATKVRAKAPEVVTPPETGTVEYYTLTAFDDENSAVSRTVKVVWDDEDEDVLYVSGLSYYIPSAFVKGTFVSDSKVVFESGQYMGNLGVDVYFVGYNNGISDVEAVYDEADGTFTFSGLILDNSSQSELNYYAYMYNVILTPSEDGPEVPVEIPSDLEIETYAYSAYDYFSDNAEVSGNLNIGIYGSDVYIQGMSVDYPEAWIKGTFTDETTISFPSGQLLTDERSLYFIAINDDYDIVDSYTLIYDPATGGFSEGPQAPMINAYKDKLQISQFFYGYEIKKITEKAAVPAKSAISSIFFGVTGDDVLEYTLAKVDEDGEGLVVDKLYYKVWYQGQDETPVAYTFTQEDYENLTEAMTEVPAAFTDGADIMAGKLTLRMKDYASWSAIGIQGIYYGGGERNESEIAWYAPTWPTVTELPEGLTVTKHTFKGENLKGAAIERVVGLAFDGDDMYIQGLGGTDETAWVKGTKNPDGDYVFPCGQDMGVYFGEERLFLLGYTEGVTDAVLTVNATDGVYEFTTDVIENADYTDKLYYVEYINAGATITIAEAQEEVPTLVEVPEGLETEGWTFSATDYFDKVTVARTVNVGFDGVNVYVQGLSETLPEAWVMGTIEDDQITFASGQYLGKDDEDDLWFIGYNFNSGISDYVMSYDAATFTMTNTSEDELFGVNAYKNKVQQSLWEFYQVVTIKKVTEKAATPATPKVSTMAFTTSGAIAEFEVPIVDVNNDGLVTDKLFYKLYYDNGDGEAQVITLTKELYEKLTEDMTEIPYGFTEDWDIYADGIYLNMDYSSWTRIGIQSFYAGGGETNASEIGWYTIIRPQITTLPEGAETTDYKFTASDIANGGDIDKSVKVAMVGDDVYVQGFSSVSDETWIKGTKSAGSNVYTFAKGQYLGVYTNEQTQRSLYVFLVGYNNTLGVIDVKMTFDPETKTFTANTYMIENATYVDKLSYLSIMSAAQLAPDNDTAVTAVDAELGDNGGVRYNLAGQPVDKNFKGIFIENGKKYLKK